MKRANELLQRTSNQQKAAFAACAVIVGAGLMWFFDSAEPSNRSVHNGDSETTRIVADLTRGARAERSWLDISEDRFSDMEARLKRLEKERQKLEQDNEALNQRNTELSENANQAIDTQAEEIERLREQVAAISQGTQGQVGTGQQTGQASGVTTTPNLSNLPAAITDNPFERAHNDLAPQIRPRNDLRSNPNARTGEAPKAANLIHFNLGEREGGSKDLSQYIPAGAYAPAEVISGVDAAVGLNAQADPRPVLFHITGPAVTAALGSTRQTADIEGCTVTGAAFGDLSSEKVYVRLQTMTCSRRHGQVFETEIQGYMAGAGKAGVRGVVVSREGALVAQSFVAGAVSGIGGAAAEAMQPQVIDTGVGVTTGQQQITDILKGGVGQGLDNAGSKVADYLVKRAEQYQPVVVMQAGTRVELVFIAGVELDPEGQIKTVKRESR
ncbi:MAG: TrbI/VirB10 family protein [Sphingomonadales bacterium]